MKHTVPKKLVLKIKQSGTIRKKQIGWLVIGKWQQLSTF